MSDLVFLKLGGSLITDKDTPGAFRHDDCVRLGREIREAMAAASFCLVLGHGAGSFAHVPAAQYNTRAGLPGGGGWKGYAETRRAVVEMNACVLAAFAEADFHPLNAPPSVLARASGGVLTDFDLRPVRTFLDAGQTPLVFGDVVLDDQQGFTICSTESILIFFARHLNPTRVLLASDVDGVFAENPHGNADATHIPLVDTARRAHSPLRLEGARGSDVTGGMAAKVGALVRIAAMPSVRETRILSGRMPGAVREALLGTYEGGTVVR